MVAVATLFAMSSVFRKRKTHRPALMDKVEGLDVSIGGNKLVD